MVPGPLAGWRVSCPPVWEIRFTLTPLPIYSVSHQVDSRVCFRYEDDHCQWEADIQITACTGFLVYYLPNTPECTLRYCGAD